MYKIIVSICTLCFALSLRAQPVSGLRIDGGNLPILVYVEGTQVCQPATSCFVANLASGTYLVEVYASRPTRPGERSWKGERLYSERLYFSGHGVKDILLSDRGDAARPDRPGRHVMGEPRPERGHLRVMDDLLFSQFMDNMRKEPFSNNRKKLIETALAGSGFTSAQCLQVAKLYSFDKDRMEVMKMMYPRVVDREAFFTVIDALTFSSNKDAMRTFVREYERR